jgi:hypothetical protein
MTLSTPIIRALQQELMNANAALRTLQRRDERVRQTMIQAREYSSVVDVALVDLWIAALGDDEPGK